MATITSSPIAQDSPHTSFNASLPYNTSSPKMQFDHSQVDKKDSTQDLDELYGKIMIHSSQDENPTPDSKQILPKSSPSKAITRKIILNEGNNLRVKRLIKRYNKKRVNNFKREKMTRCKRHKKNEKRIYPRGIRKSVNSQISIANPNQPELKQDVISIQREIGQKIVKDLINQNIKQETKEAKAQQAQQSLHDEVTTSFLDNLRISNCFHHHLSEFLKNNPSKVSQKLIQIISQVNLLNLFLFVQSRGGAAKSMKEGSLYKFCVHQKLLDKRSPDILMLYSSLLQDFDRKILNTNSHELHEKISNHPQNQQYHHEDKMVQDFIINLDRINNFHISLYNFLIRRPLQISLNVSQCLSKISLFDLCTFVISHGGFIQVLKEGLIKEFCFKRQLPEVMEGKFIQIYAIMLLDFEQKFARPHNQIQMNIPQQPLPQPQQIQPPQQFQIPKTSVEVPTNSAISNINSNIDSNEMSILNYKMHQLMKLRDEFNKNGDKQNALPRKDDTYIKTICKHIYILSHEILHMQDLAKMVQDDTRRSVVELHRAVGNVLRQMGEKRYPESCVVID